MADNSQDGPAAVAVPWSKCMPYEKTEVINDLRGALSQALFAPDDVQLQVTDSVRCVAGAGVDRTHSLVLDGFVSSSRVPAIDIIEAKTQKTVSDFRARVDFGACVGDELPAMPVLPIGAANSATTAKRLWQRARWAVRCGVVKRIGDARGMIDPQASDAKPEGEDDKRPRRDFLPMAQYHESSTSPCISLSRFAANNPCVIVAWASWDAASVEYLRRHVFPLIQSPESEDASRTDSSVGDSAGTPMLPPSTIAEDPWLQLASQHVDFHSFHEHISRRLPQIDPHVSSSVRHTAAGVAQQVAINNAMEAEATRAGIPAANRSYTAFGNVTRPLGGYDANDESPGDNPLVAAVRRSKKEKDRKKKRSRWQVSRLSEADQQRSLNQVVNVAGQARAQGRRALRLGHIVLVSFDQDADAAVVVLRELMDRLGSWSSAHVALHTVWAGEEGLHGELGTYLNARELPAVVAAQPEPLHVGDRDLWYEVPVVANVVELGLGIDRRRGSVVGTAAALEEGPKSRRLWHELSHATRSELEAPITAIMETAEAQLVWESGAWAEYALHGPAVADSTLETAASCSSTVSLRGVITEQQSAELLPHVRKILSTVRGFHLDVQVIEAAPALALPINERTAEHRVQGWSGDVTCAHCDKRLHVRRDDHYHCIHCRSDRSSVCAGCLKDHDESHVLLLIFAGAAHTISVLWGAGNVAQLPLLRGRLVANESGVHIGVYCNACAAPIKGVRWKCACCVDVDLCTTCFDYWASSAKQGRKTERRHPHDHIFLRISCAVPGDCNSMMTPRSVPMNALA
jgi:hypothetical protein